MNFLKNKGLYRELFKLALPIALSSLVSFSISLSDNMMIATLGNEAVSSVYLGNQIALLFTMLTVGIEGGVLVLASQMLGSEKEDKARSVAFFGLLSALALALLFFALSFFFPKFTLGIITDKRELIESGAPFLRMLGISFLFFAPSQVLSAALKSAKQAKISLFSALLALAVNVFLNYALIFGKLGFPTLGILGAGIATLAARGIEFSFLFVYSFFIDKRLGLRLPSFIKPDKDVLPKFFKTAAPIFATQGAWSVNTFFATAVMGRMPAPGVVAGLSAALALYNLSYVVTNGISGAVGIIVGRLVGRGDEGAKNELRNFSKTVQVLFIFLGILTAVFMQIAKAPFLELWGIDAAARRFALAFIAVLSVMVIGTAYQSATLGGIIKSAGEVRFVFKTESFSIFCLIIPAALLLLRFSPAPAIMLAILKSDQLFKCPIAFFKLRKLFAKS